MKGLLIRVFDVITVPVTDFGGPVLPATWKDLNCSPPEGISRGCVTGIFCPDDTVRRDKMVVSLGRTFPGMPQSNEFPELHLQHERQWFPSCMYNH